MCNVSFKYNKRVNFKIPTLLDDSASIPLQTSNLLDYEIPLFSRNMNELSIKNIKFMQNQKSLIRNKYYFIYKEIKYENREYHH